MIKLINFLKKIGFGRGALKLLNSKLLNIYLQRNNIQSIEYNYFKKKFLLFPLDNTTDNKMILSSKKYEKTELYFLKKLEKTDNSVFLDIGANMGYYSIMCSDFKFKKIYAFEPVPKMVLRIQKNIEINNLKKIIEIVPYAIGEETKEVLLYEEPTNYGGSSLFQSLKRTKETKVQMITLDKFIFENSITNIDALKIDVEGYEDKILLPFFKNNQTSLFPKLVIIEHSSFSKWKENIIQWMINNNYALIHKSRSNTILKYQYN